MPDHLKEMESLEHAVTIESLMMDMQDLGEASSLCRFYLKNVPGSIVIALHHNMFQSQKVQTRKTY